MKKISITPKTRRWVLTIGISLIAFGGLWIYFAVTDSSKAVSKPATNILGTSLATGQTTNANSKSVMAAGSQVAPADQWLATAGTDMSKMKDQVVKVEQQFVAVTDAQEKLRAELLPKLNAILDKQSAIKTMNDTTTPVKPGTASVAVYPPQDALPRRNAPLRGPAASGSMAIGGPNFSDTDNLAPRRAGIVRLSSLRGDGDVPSSANTIQNQPSINPQLAQRRTVDNYLPISFTPAVLLGGLDAPTGGQSQTNPHPVLMRLETNANLPNRFRSGVKECLVIGSGYGDISSERCYIRTERLSCVKEDGSIMETKLNGSVFGEDGKIGMRGHLVEKQGQILANALLAGGIGGIGKGLIARASIVNTTALGSTATVGSGKEFESGIGTGIGNAMDRLAQYYISVAEKVFPIIECDAGRRVDVVVTEGIRLDDDGGSKTKDGSIVKTVGKLIAPRLTGSGGSDE